MTDTAPRKTRFILDTNIWLDWFVFAQVEGSAMARLKAFCTDFEQISIVMTQAMWDEWVDVLGRETFAVAPEQQAWIHEQTRALVTWTQDTPPLQGSKRIRCADRDDQVFIDTALAQRVDWLISKDRHLLKLRNRAQQQNVRIATPEQWFMLHFAGKA